MTHQLLTAPTLEPLSVDDAMALARLDGAHWTPIVEAAIPAARAVCEHETGLRLMQQVWRYTLAEWPADPLPEHNATAVAITYRDNAGQWQTLSSALYLWANTNDGLRLALAEGAVLPTYKADPLGAGLRIDVTSGATTREAVPAPARTFIGALVAVMVHDPSLTATEAMSANVYLPRILDPLRLYR